MSQDRRAFLRRSAAVVGSLLVGDAALETFDRLTHRKVFALGGLPATNPSGGFYRFDLPAAATERVGVVNGDIWMNERGVFLHLNNETLRLSTHAAPGYPIPTWRRVQ